MRVELPELFSGDGDLGDPSLEWPSPAAKVSFQVSYEPRLDGASTAAPPAMERPWVGGSNHALDVLAPAIFAPCHSSVEMLGDDRLQRRGGPQRLKAGWGPPQGGKLLLALPLHGPVKQEGAVPPQIPLASSVFEPIAVGARRRRYGMREPDMPGFQPRDIADE